MRSNRQEKLLLNRLNTRTKFLNKLKQKNQTIVSKCEKNVLKTCRRFFAAGCNLKKGSILTKDNIIGLRSTKGISVLSPKMLLNRKIKKNLPFREIINMTDLI